MYNEYLEYNHMYNVYLESRSQDRNPIVLLNGEVFWEDDNDLIVFKLSTFIKRITHREKTVLNKTARKRGIDMRPGNTFSLHLRHLGSQSYRVIFHCYNPYSIYQLVDITSQITPFDREYYRNHLRSLQ